LILQTEEGSPVGTRKYPVELRERAVRLYRESRERLVLATEFTCLMDKRDYPPFFSHTGDVPSHFLNDEPPVATLDAPHGADAAVPTHESDGDTAAAMPNWFCDFLIDRATPKPSEHTLKAYRQDFTAVGVLLRRAVLRTSR
jgi:hypothetical protein